MQANEFTFVLTATSIEGEIKVSIENTMRIDLTNKDNLLALDLLLYKVRDTILDKLGIDAYQLAKRLNNAN